MINRDPYSTHRGITEVKRLLLDAMSSEQKLYMRHIDELREELRWRQRAELAVGKGEDELARAALIRVGRHSMNASRFHEDYLEQKRHVERLKRELLEIQSGVHLPRSSPATAMAEIERGLLQLDRQQSRASEERARLAAMAELERDELAEKLAAMEREDLLDRQLAELKSKVGKKEEVPAPDATLDHEM